MYEEASGIGRDQHDAWVARPCEAARDEKVAETRWTGTRGGLHRLPAFVFQMMSEDISVRTGQERDCQALVDFNIAMARETEGKELLPDVVSEGVRSLLRNPQNGFYVIAERDDDITGCLMVTTEWSDWRNGEFWWIQSVYVKPEFRRQGIYRRLYDFVRSKAAEKDNVCGFRLYVERKNAIAQQTYRQMGMEETPYKIFEELTNR